LGRVQQPEYDTLERILLALNARYTERREVFELFGYLVDAPIPIAEEVNWAISVCQAELDMAMFPAYLLDCSHRLLYWNQLVPRLFDMPQASSFERLNQLSMLKIIFDPDYLITPKIKNIEAFFPAQIRALRYEMQRFHDEAWYAALINEMLNCKEFNHYWNIERQEPIHIAARPLTPILLEVCGHLLSFRLIAEPFVQDHRFRVIYYIPVDSQTTQQCMLWMDDSALQPN
jgi:hypothetical protein